MKSHRKYDIAIGSLLCLMICSSFYISSSLSDKCTINPYLCEDVVVEITEDIIIELLVDEA